MRRRDPKVIWRARKRARYTQRELAGLVGVSQTTIWLLEQDEPKGMDSCSDALAFRLAERLGVAPEDLFHTETGSRPPVKATGYVAARPSGPSS